MADEEEKTEEPTSKKIEDAKNEGNVSKSMEVSGAAVLFFGTMYLLFFSSYSLFYFVDHYVDLFLVSD